MLMSAGNSRWSRTFQEDPQSKSWSSKTQAAGNAPALILALALHVAEVVLQILPPAAQHDKLHAFPHEPREALCMHASHWIEPISSHSRPY